MEISFEVQPGERLEYVNTATVETGETRDVPHGPAHREVYVVVGGHGTMRTAGAARAVWPGDSIPVERGTTTLTAADCTLVVMIHGIEKMQ
jgi:mannose-6-phosphate isomerase-like protein (cupin superfamily)